MVLTGPISSVKEQVTGHDAERFAQRGYAALAFDHRKLRESEGEPREHEDAAAKVSDLRNAVSTLARRPDLDADRAEAFRAQMAEFAAIAERQFDTGEIEYWPATNPAGMPGPEPYAYYGTNRGARPTGRNRCTALSELEELTVDAGVALPLVAPTPLLIVHGRATRRARPTTPKQPLTRRNSPKRSSGWTPPTTSTATTTPM
jgi:hypothetical protein